MPKVFPFRGYEYAESLDLAGVIAPPYDVLDASGKAALAAKSPCNVVLADLPHIPAKELGPPAAYANSAAAFRSWIDSRTLVRAAAPTMYCYRQTFSFAGKTHRRTGMACTVEALPFGPRPGGGILPHEQTFSGPKEDRLALMKASACQFSPIFGLHADPGATAAGILARVCSSRPPDRTATTAWDSGHDTLTHEVWRITDERTIADYARVLAGGLGAGGGGGGVGQDVFIADGHHRYNTALNYLNFLEAQTGAPLPADHPARRCMIVLVSMEDPGLVIGPTHRVLGGMSNWSIDAFEKAAHGKLTIRRVACSLHALEAEMSAAAAGPQGVLGIYDFTTKSCAIAIPASPDPLAASFPDMPRAWRELDVALVQHLVVDQVCKPVLNSGKDVAWAFPHSIDEVAAIGRGVEKGSGGGKGFDAQVAVIVRPTPLESVRAVSAAGKLMPQKSTFFYPKLATGLFFNPLA